MVDIRTVAAVGGPILVALVALYLHRREERDTPAEAQRKIDETLDEDLAPESAYRVEKCRVVGATDGSMTVSLRVNGPGVSRGNPWTIQEFDDLADRHGVEASYDTVDVKPPLKVEVTVDSLDVDTVAPFVRGLGELVAESSLRS